MADTWAAQWADSWASGSQRFNPYHSKPGSPTGGQFSSAGGGSGGGGKAAATAAHPAPAAAAHPATAVTKARQAHLRERAAADRVTARKLEAQLRALEKQHAAAAAAAKHSAAVAKQKHPTSAKKAAAHHKARKASAHHASLKQRITALRGRIHTLLSQAKQLDAQAAAL